MKGLRKGQSQVWLQALQLVTLTTRIEIREGRDVPESFAQRVWRDALGMTPQKRADALAWAESYLAGLPSRGGLRTPQGELDLSFGGGKAA